jgi:predicted lipoprotein with Yx(FWY)xxD motif
MWTNKSQVVLSGLAIAGALLAPACATRSEGSAQPQQRELSQQAPDDSFGERRSEEGGYWPASVQLGQSPVLGPVVLDGRGFTLYRFEKDTADPVKATCVDECARQWPPVLADEKIQFQNLDPAVIGTVTRKDGTRQVTIGGRPVYRYSKDSVPGLFSGHGQNRQWFVIAPDGSKASLNKTPTVTRTSTRGNS